MVFEGTRRANLQQPDEVADKDGSESVVNRGNRCRHGCRGHRALKDIGLVVSTHALRAREEKRRTTGCTERTLYSLQSGP